MKTAVIRVIQFGLCCPHCEEQISTGTGVVWPQEAVLTCEGCGAKSKRPSDKRLNALFQVSRRKARAAGGSR